MNELALPIGTKLNVPNNDKGITHLMFNRIDNMELINYLPMTKPFYTMRGDIEIVDTDGARLIPVISLTDVRLEGILEFNAIKCKPEMTVVERRR